MTTKTISAALVALALAAGSVGAATVTEFHWNGPIARGRTVEIRNINGSIKAEAATGGTLEVLAVKSAKKGGDPDKVKLEVFEHDGTITFCALYPAKDGYPPNTCDEHGNTSHVSDLDNVTVDFRVRVPAGVKLEARTVNGDVRASGMTAPVTATSVNGQIRVVTTSWAEAVTVNGDVAVAMAGRGWPDALDFKSVNGSILLDLDGSPDADLSAETMNGTIDSDFPVTVQGKQRRNRMRGTLGGGGTDLGLSTLNGSIQLRRASP